MKWTLVKRRRVKSGDSIFQVEENRPAEAIQRDLVLGHVVAVVTLSADDICSDQQRTTPGPARPAGLGSAAHTHTSISRQL